MGIRHYGFNLFGFGTGLGKSRSDTFRKGRQLGDKVQGRLLKWVSNDIAWVAIDGQKLLAQLKSKASVGAQLTFVIKQLNPEVILKEVFGQLHGKTDILHDAHEFETARALFEASFEPFVSPFIQRSSHSWQKHFMTLLSQEKELFTNFMRTSRCLKKLETTIGDHLAGSLWYTPWLLPHANHLLGFHKFPRATSSLTESLVEYDETLCGKVRIEILYKHPKISYRLKLQHISHGKRIQSSLESLVGSKAQCIGVNRLRQHEMKGLLTEAMFEQ